MLNAKQRSYLGSLASRDAVVVQLGKGGPSDAFVGQLKALLAKHELVKVKFVDFKDDKRNISADLSTATGSELVRVIGNCAIFYLQNSDPEKRSVELP